MLNTSNKVEEPVNLEQVGQVLPRGGEECCSVTGALCIPTSVEDDPEP